MHHSYRIYPIAVITCQIRESGLCGTRKKGRQNEKNWPASNQCSVNSDVAISTIRHSPPASKTAPKMVIDQSV